MSQEQVHLGCPVCVSFASFNSEDEAESKVKSHNEGRHDGEEVARIIEPDSEDCVNEFVDVARERTPEQQYKELIRKITRENTPFTVATLG